MCRVRCPHTFLSTMAWNVGFRYWSAVMKTFVEETERCVTQTLLTKKFRVMSVCPTSVPVHVREFRLAHITGPKYLKGQRRVSGKRVPLWNYRTKLPHFAQDDYARVVVIDDVPVIGLIRSGKLVMAIPVNRLPWIIWLKNGYWYPGTSTGEVIALKRKVSKELDLPISWSDAEEHLIAAKKRQENERAKKIAKARDAEMRSSTENVEVGVARLAQKWGCNLDRSVA